MAALYLAGLFFTAHAAMAEGDTAPANPHENHAAPLGNAGEEGVRRSEHHYQIPALKLTRQDGKQVEFPQELNDGRAVIVNFVFTSCSSICPVLSHVFAQVQGKFGSDLSNIHLVSVTLDPEHDTPERLQEFAHKLKASPQWDFYTGSSAANIKLQKAFEVYRGDKMNHEPLVLMRSAPGQAWVRLEGFVSPSTIVGEYRSTLAAR